MDLLKLESPSSRRVVKRGMENIPQQPELDDLGHEHRKEMTGLVWVPFILRLNLI